MGNTNSLPVVSQIKSTVQLLSGDVTGAVETQEKFLHECPLVAQATSLVELVVTGDGDEFRRTNLRSISTLSNTVNGIPVVGHAKGVIHLIAGDDEGGSQAFRSANRSTAVVGGGVVGFLVGGPIGAVAGGIAGGTTLDGVVTVIDSEKNNEFTPSGVIATVDNAFKNPSAGAIFDVVAVPVFDGVGGYGAGQVTAKIQQGLTKGQLTKAMTERDAAGAKLNDGIFDGKMTDGEALAEGSRINQMTGKINALESRLGAVETFTDPKTGVTTQIKSQNAIPETNAVKCTTTAAATTQKEEDILGEKFKSDMYNLEQLLEREILTTTDLNKSIVKFINQLLRGKSELPTDIEHEDEDDEEDDDAEIRCIHWNAGGLFAQLRVTFGFVLYLLFTKPDIVFLNEIKSKNLLIEALPRILNYSVVYTPSSAPNNRYMRGSAIFYRSCKKFTATSGLSKQEAIVNNVAEVELVCLDIKLKNSGQKYRLVSAYVLKDKHFETAANVFCQISPYSPEKVIVIAGDLNMEKSKYLNRWEGKGYIDRVAKKHATNLKSHLNSATCIDYVMVKRGDERHVRCDLPLCPEGKSVHLLIPFVVGPNSLNH